MVVTSYSKPASQHYTEAKLKQLLADAELNASRDWDSNFISDMLSRFKTYGMGMHISTLQKHHLERIANLDTERTRNGTHN